MKSLSHATSLALLLSVFALASCENDSTSPTDLANNAPVIVSVTTAFTYVMMADRFTASVNYDLAFTTDSLVYSMVVASFGGGTSTFIVNDASGNTVLRDSVFTTKVNTVIQSGKGIPRRCTLSFQNFSGKMTMSLTANQGRH